MNPTIPQPLFLQNMPAGHKIVTIPTLQPQVKASPPSRVARFSPLKNKESQPHMNDCEWTETDYEVLNTFAYTNGWIDATEALGNHQPYVVRQKWEAMMVKNEGEPTPWTKKEIRILRSVMNVPSGWRVVIDKLKSHPLKSIESKMTCLKKSPARVFMKPNPPVSIMPIPDHPLTPQDATRLLAWYRSEYRNMVAEQEQAQSVVDDDPDFPVWTKEELNTIKMSRSVEEAVEALKRHAKEEVEQMFKHVKALGFSVWTPEEDQILRELADVDAGWRKAIPKLPYRTPAAINSRWMFLKQPGLFTDDEIELIKTVIDQPNGWKLVVDKLPNHNPAMVERKWKQLVSPVTLKRALWTKEEVAIIMTVVEEKNGWKKVVELIPAHTPTSIMRKWTELRPNRLRRVDWTPDELKLLRGTLDRKRGWKSVVADIPNHPRSSIQHKWDMMHAEQVAHQELGGAISPDSSKKQPKKKKTTKKSATTKRTGKDKETASKSKSAAAKKNRPPK